MPAPRTLAIERLRKVWAGGTVALDDVTLTVSPGEVVAVLGRSGSGKSTLLRCIARLVEPTSGRVTLGATDVTAARGRVLYEARSRIGFVFQQFNLVRSYTVRDNVLAGRLAHVPAWRAWTGIFDPRDISLAERCLADVGMADRASSLARELSGGQQQRVAIARAFAQQPEALLADEPTASLDPHLASTVLGLLRAYGREHSVPVLLNVHTVDHARHFADRVIGLRDGRLVHDGPAASIDDTALASIYGAPEDA